MIIIIDIYDISTIIPMSFRQTIFPLFQVAKTGYEMLMSSETNFLRGRLVARLKRPLEFLVTQSRGWG